MSHTKFWYNMLLFRKLRKSDLYQISSKSAEKFWGWDRQTDDTTYAVHNNFKHFVQRLHITLHTSQNILSNLNHRQVPFWEIPQTLHLLLTCAKGSVTLRQFPTAEDSWREKSTQLDWSNFCVASRAAAAQSVSYTKNTVTNTAL
jgi:hypothetical protein